MQFPKSRTEFARMPVKIMKQLLLAHGEETNGKANDLRERLGRLMQKHNVVLPKRASDTQKY